MSSDPFLQRLQERQKQQMPIPETKEQPIQQKSIIQPTQNPFERRLEERKSDRYKKESEMIWDQGENLEREAERGTAQATSRVLESALGTPGNIQSLIKGITGVQLGTQLPTSSDIKEFSEKATKGYTKPRSEFEEKGGEILQDITAMAMPGSANYGILRNIGIPIAGFLAKEGLSSLGSDKSTQDAGKIALMVGLDLASAYQSKGKGGARVYAQKLWKEGESNIPKGVSINASKLEEGLNVLKSNIEKGGSSPADAPALKKIEEIIGKVKKGKIPVDELVSFRKKINDLIDSRGGFEIGTHGKIAQDAVRKLNEVKDNVIGTLNEYGKINPKFGVPYKDANEAYAVYHASNKIGNFLKKNFGDYIKSPLFHGLFGTVAKAKGLAAIGAPYHAYKIYDRVVKSPVLAKFYGNILKAGLENNTQVALKNLESLRKELEKEKTTLKAYQSSKKK